MLIYSFAPSDRRAATVDEFLAVCQAEPGLAADHLRQGYFEPWLRDTGRPDLAQAAARARAGNPPATAALARFLRAAGASASRPQARRGRGPRLTGACAPGD